MASAKHVSMADRIHALRDRMFARRGLAAPNRPLVERLDERRMLSITAASVQTPDGSGHIYEGGLTATFNLYATCDDSPTAVVWDVDFGDGTKTIATAS